MNKVVSKIVIFAWQRGEGGSEMFKICVTSFMNAPLPLPESTCDRVSGTNVAESAFWFEITTVVELIICRIWFWSVKLLFGFVMTRVVEFCDGIIIVVEFPVRAQPSFPISVQSGRDSSNLSLSSGVPPFPKDQIFNSFLGWSAPLPILLQSLFLLSFTLSA